MGAMEGGDGSSGPGGGADEERGGGELAGDGRYIRHCEAITELWVWGVTPISQTTLGAQLHKSHHKPYNAPVNFNSTPKLSLHQGVKWNRGRDFRCHNSPPSLPHSPLIPLRQVIRRWCKAFPVNPSVLHPSLQRPFETSSPSHCFGLQAESLWSHYLVAMRLATVPATDSPEHAKGGGLLRCWTPSFSVEHPHHYGGAGSSQGPKVD